MTLTATAMELIDQLERHAGSRPDEVAVSEAPGSPPATKLTWRQWRDASAGLARALRERTDAGATVLLGLGNDPAFHVAFVGVLLADRRAMPISAESTPHEVAQLIRRAGATAAIGPAAFLSQPGIAPLIHFEREQLLADSGGDFAAARATHDGSGAVLLTTSGTTGQPKIVERVASSLDAVARGCARGIGWRASDHALLTVPLHHSYGLEHGLLTPLYAGAAVELMPALGPAPALARLLEGPATILPSVPFILEAIAGAQARGTANAAPHALRRVYSAGSPLPAAVFDTWDRLLHVRVGQVYGSTEIGSLTFNDADDPAFDPRSVGAALPGMEVRVLDPDDPVPDRAQPAGEIGCVAGASKGMMRRYLGEPDDPLADGFRLTEDLGFLDPAGRLTLTGRRSLLIDVGSRKVNPLEVEAVLAEHPQVAEAAVCPLPVTDTVNRLRAVVVAQPGAALAVDDLRRFARARLSPHKRPRLYETRDALPRSAAGKILREGL